jgi:hypothetical protein
MLHMTFCLNQVPDGSLTIRVDDIQMLKAELYDDAGDAIMASDYTAMDASLIVRRTDEDATDDIVIAAETDAVVTDNIWFFSLEDLNYEPGNYEAHIVLEGAYEDLDGTPISTTSIGPTTPLDLVLSFELFNIEVLA